MKLDILIPTYNRPDQLKKNLQILINGISNLGIDDCVKIIVSDNFSEKSPKSLIFEAKRGTNVKVILFEHEENLGIEGNSAFLLENASADYVMFLGDDDYISEEYLNEVINHIYSNAFACIIPSFLAVTSKGMIVGSRGIGRRSVYKMGIDSASKLALLGHQLSGIVFLRSGILEKYLMVPKRRNIYLFISFLGLSCMRGDALLLSEYPVKVTVGELKYWNYGNDALFNEKIKNVKVIAGNRIEIYKLEKVFFIKNIYSIIAIYPKFKQRVYAFINACFSPHLSMLFKITIPIWSTIFLLKCCSSFIFKSYEPLK